MVPESNRLRARWLSEQIELRLRVLQLWASEGVPDTVDLPGSLNKVRLWRSAEYGIEPIGSPSSFTTTHSIHGADVNRIRGLLKDLGARARRKRARGDSAKLLELERQRVAQCKEALSEAANQFVQLSVELADTKRRLRVAQSSLETMEREARERGEVRPRQSDPHSSVNVLGTCVARNIQRLDAALGSGDTVDFTE